MKKKGKRKKEPPPPQPDVLPNSVPPLRAPADEDDDPDDDLLSPPTLAPLGESGIAPSTAVWECVLLSTLETRFLFDAFPASSLVRANSREISLAISLTRIAGSSCARPATVETRFGILMTLSRRPERESKMVFVMRRRLSRTTALPPRDSRSMIRLKKADWTTSFAATALDVRRSWRWKGQHVRDPFYPREQRPTYFVEGFEQVLERGRLAPAEGAKEGLERGRLQQAVFDARSLVLEPTTSPKLDPHTNSSSEVGGPRNDSIQRRVRPERVLEEAEVKVDPVVLPQDLATRLARVGEIAQDREGELLEGRVGLDDALEERDSACDGGLLLPVLAQATEVEEGVDDVVLDLLQTFPHMKGFSLR